MTNGVNKNQHAKLNGHRITRTQSGFDSSVEFGRFFGGNNSALDKTFHHRTRPSVDNNFSANENWQRDQKPHMRLKVPEKTEVAVAEQLPAVQAK